MIKDTEIMKEYSQKSKCDNLSNLKAVIVILFVWAALLISTCGLVAHFSDPLTMIQFFAIVIFWMLAIVAFKWVHERIAISIKRDRAIEKRNALRINK